MARLIFAESVKTLAIVAAVVLLAVLYTAAFILEDRK